MHKITALAAALPLLSAACQSAPETPQARSDATVSAATIDGETITLDELDGFVKEELLERATRGRNPSRLYETRAEALNRLIVQRALENEAQRRGLGVDALLAAELAERPVTDEEIAAIYEANPEQVGDASLEEMSPAIRRYLEEEREREVQAAIVEASAVTISLRAPRVEVAARGPRLGPESAPVTIIEFSDFQCPYCRRASPVMKDLAERYPDEVRIVYRHLPLTGLHARAQAAALASTCADDQGRFWPYHDLLFENPRAMSDEDLRRYAEEVGLELTPFDECLASGRNAPLVEEDVQAAQAIGISGTPAFVVNGIVVFGLQSTERFDELIQEELDGAS
jgi:protein-disulfide isomerase